MISIYSQECQKAAWPVHKEICDTVTAFEANVKSGAVKVQHQAQGHE